MGVTGSGCSTTVNDEGRTNIKIDGADNTYKEFPAS